MVVTGIDCGRKEKEIFPDRAPLKRVDVLSVLIPFFIDVSCQLTNISTVMLPVAASVMLMYETTSKSG